LVGPKSVHCLPGSDLHYDGIGKSGGEIFVGKKEKHLCDGKKLRKYDHLLERKELKTLETEGLQKMRAFWLQKHSQGYDWKKSPA